MLQVSSQSLLNSETSTQSVGHCSIGSRLLSDDIFPLRACVCVRERDRERQRQRERMAGLAMICDLFSVLPQKGSPLIGSSCPAFLASSLSTTSVERYHTLQRTVFRFFRSQKSWGVLVY